MLAEGTTAPDFELENTNGSTSRLSDERGRPVVLYFYPQDGTAGCTIEARKFRAYFDALSLHQATIFGVSRDSTQSHCDFRDREGLPFELLSDPDCAVHDEYGAWRHNRLLRRRTMRRCTYLIAPDGTIAKAYPRPNPAGHARSVVQDIEHLGHARGWFDDH